MPRPARSPRGQATRPPGRYALPDSPRRCELGGVPEGVGRLDLYPEDPRALGGTYAQGGRGTSRARVAEPRDAERRSRVDDRQLVRDDIAGCLVEGEREAELERSFRPPELLCARLRDRDGRG